ncbi:MAG: cytochrome-c peroxidase [Sediminibacterium sp.]
MRYSRTIITIAILASLSISWITLNNIIKPTPVSFIVPKGWPKPVYDFKSNPLTKEGIELGRQLFYDTRLSKDGSISCGTCHQQFGAFNTYDHNLSHGFNNSLTTRNAPGLFNLAWQKEFMWDGGINHLDLQPLAPITAENEMAENLVNLIKKLQAEKAYRQLFKAAFGDETISTQRITKALSQFLLTFVSSNSKYDRVQRGLDTFILPEKLGYEIFKQKCVSCHTEPLFTDYSYRNIGMPLDPFLKDLGRMKITNESSDSLKFRVPSLRNVMRTFPYGHDGRFFSIISVMDHYRKNMVIGPTTDSLLENRLPLSNFEIGQITAFLYTLTDTSFLNNPNLAQPGKGISTTAPADIHNN